MDMSTIIGGLIGGFATRIYACIGAATVFAYASEPFANAMGQIKVALAVIN